MYNKIGIIGFVFFFNLVCFYGQSETFGVNKVENFILQNKKDSALLVCDRLIEDKSPNTSYLQTLQRIALSQELNYEDLYTFINKITNGNRVSKIDIHHYLIEYLDLPKKDLIDISYVKIKWLQITFLTELVMMEEAEREHEVLSKYIEQYNEKDDNVKRAIFYKNIYPIILTIIKRSVEEGEKLCFENEEIAKSLNDTSLVIISNYYNSDFLLIRGELEKYISLCETNLILENKRSKKSNFYYGNLCHLIDALIYKGGEEERIFTLLDEVYNSTNYKEYSYSYYIQLLGSLSDTVSYSKRILNKFKVNNIIELSDTLIQKSKSIIPPNEYYQLLRIVGDALFSKGYYKKANKIHYLSVTHIREIYTRDLAGVLATNKIRGIVKEKEYELSLANEKSKRFLYSLILLGVIVFITVLSILILRVKHKKLTKREQEKQLLLQEIHHRVKNNFQIVSSLLKLQVKGIKDEKAIEMAIEGQNRVKSMSLIHEKLYQNDDLEVELEGYITTLVNNINILYNKVNVKKEINIPKNCSLDIDTAVPLGLILNELITNAFKYAFLDSNQQNILTIHCQKDEAQNILIVKDNGKGMNNEVSFESANSIGLRLIKNLAKQLHGSVEYEYNEGAIFKVFYKETILREAVD